METITKALALVSGGEATDEHPNGAFEVILSSPTKDRDGEIIDPKAFEPLPDHIPFDIDHGMSVTTTVGSGAPYYAADGTLRVKGGFASTNLAQEVRSLVTEGHIRTTSVTFMAATRTKDEKGVPHVTTAELLNGTFTPVPSNRESVVLSAKALAAKAGARNSAADMELIQAAHDALMALGAACAGEKRYGKNPMARVDEKSIVGSVEALRDRVCDALEDAYDRWTCLRGVIPNPDGTGGTVVFDSYDDGYDIESYQQTYTDDGAVVTLTGQASVVDILEIVTPDADADREYDETLKSASDAADPAAPAAGSAAEDADAVSKTPDDVQARLRVTENAARFAFGAL